MDNSFFYGMMEENTSKKAVYTAGFLLAVPIPAFHPIRSADRKDVGAGSPFG